MNTIIPNSETVLHAAQLAQASHLHLIKRKGEARLSPTVPPGWYRISVSIKKGQPMYTLQIPQDKLLDSLIETWLNANPDKGVDDALESIFAAGVRAQLLGNLERCIKQRQQEGQSSAAAVFQEATHVNVYP